MPSAPAIRRPITRPARSPSRAMRRPAPWPRAARTMRNISTSPSRRSRICRSISPAVMSTIPTSMTPRSARSRRATTSRPAFAIRGTLATGFRAPTLPESYYTQTNVSPTSATVQIGPNSPAASAGRHQAAEAGKLGQLQPRLCGASVRQPQRHARRLFDRHRQPHRRHRHRELQSHQCGRQHHGLQRHHRQRQQPGSQRRHHGHHGVRQRGQHPDPWRRRHRQLWQRLRRTGAMWPGPWPATGARPACRASRPIRPSWAPPRCSRRRRLSYLTNASPKFKASFGALWTLEDWTITLRETVYGPSSVLDHAVDRPGHLLSAEGLDRRHHRRRSQQGPGGMGDAQRGRQQPVRQESGNHRPGAGHHHAHRQRLDLLRAEHHLAVRHQWRLLLRPRHRSTSKGAVVGPWRKPRAASQRKRPGFRPAFFVVRREGATSSCLSSAPSSWRR